MVQVLVQQYWPITLTEIPSGSTEKVRHWDIRLGCGRGCSIQCYSNRLNLSESERVPERERDSDSQKYNLRVPTINFSLGYSGRRFTNSFPTQGEQKAPPPLLLQWDQRIPVDAFINPPPPSPEGHWLRVDKVLSTTVKYLPETFHHHV
ncbi:hypothetical protein chiPu_0015140 [Chiloscyllium punctatum]|uniref:Uncharacterized protein n=1 Tax=Chiloscyllium punctatum TaxID=137246 RepID=A0A401T1X5_CHIPU|nr:hypothetical protein [Chiloscyllium punctatum]